MKSQRIKINNQFNKLKKKLLRFKKHNFQKKMNQIQLKTFAKSNQQKHIQLLIKIKTDKRYRPNRNKFKKLLLTIKCSSKQKLHHNKKKTMDKEKSRNHKKKSQTTLPLKIIWKINNNWSRSSQAKKAKSKWSRRSSKRNQKL